MARIRHGDWPVQTEDELPPLLAAGPCIENWVPDEEQPPTTSYVSHQWRAWAAQRRWRSAVDAWAVETGWSNPGRTTWQAQDLARIKFMWSRRFLESRGEHDLIDYLEGRRAEHPGRPGPGFQPTF